MGQYSDLVEKRRDALAAEAWARKIKTISMVADKGGEKTWTTTFNDGSAETEYWDMSGFKHKEVKTSAILTVEECIDEMRREEADAAIYRN